MYSSFIQFLVFLNFKHCEGYNHCSSGRTFFFKDSGDGETKKSNGVRFSMLIAIAHIMRFLIYTNFRIYQKIKNKKKIKKSCIYQKNQKMHI